MAPPRGTLCRPGRWAVVTSPVAPTLYGGERDDEVLYGMVGEILKDKDEKGLYLVRMQYGYETLIEGAHLGIVSKAEADMWRESATHRVIAPFADVLPGPDTTAYPPLVTLPRGAVLRVGPPDSEDARWLRAELFDGAAGWIRREMVRPVRAWSALDEAQTRANLDADARLYLGTSYRWGGKTRRMLYDAPKSSHKDVPTYVYTKPGSYRPAIVLVNDAGWRPGGKTIDSGLVEMARPVVVT